MQTIRTFQIVPLPDCLMSGENLPKNLSLSNLTLGEISISYMNTHDVFLCFHLIQILSFFTTLKYFLFVHRGPSAEFKPQTTKLFQA